MQAKAFLIPGCGTEYFAAQKTGIVLSPNMDSSSFAHHHTCQAGLNQKGAKTDKHRTLFMGSKYSSGTVLQKGNIYRKKVVV